MHVTGNKNTYDFERRILYVIPSSDRKKWKRFLFVLMLSFSSTLVFVGWLLYSILKSESELSLFVLLFAIDAAGGNARFKEAVEVLVDVVEVEEVVVVDEAVVVEVLLFGEAP